MTRSTPNTCDPKGTGMTERQDLLDFLGTEALQAAGHVEPPSRRRSPGPWRRSARPRRTRPW